MTKVKRKQVKRFRDKGPGPDEKTLVKELGRVWKWLLSER